MRHFPCLGSQHCCRSCLAWPADVHVCMHCLPSSSSVPGWCGIPVVEFAVVGFDFQSLALDDLPFKGRGRPIVNQANIGTLSKATLGKLLRDGMKRRWAFPSA